MKSIQNGTREIRWLPARVRSSGGTLMAIASLLAGSGCSHLAARHAKAERRLGEHSRALNSGIVDALELAPAERRDQTVQLALELAREGERIQGLPARPIAVKDLLQIAPANTPPEEIAARHSAAAADLSRRFTEIESALRTQRSTSEKLIGMGTQFEEERNRSRRRWAAFAGSGLALAGAVAALFVFVPAALPLFGRILAWLIGKIPALAGWIGVVSVKAFDGVVRGIERAKAAPDEKETARFGNAGGNAGAQPEPWMHMLGGQLSRSLDSEHKALVRTRKGALGL